jgi:hypothetical protein
MIPHRAAACARSQRRRSRVAKPGAGRVARGKSGDGLEFPRGTLQSGAEVIVGVGVPAWKTGTAGAHNGGDLGSGGSLAEEFLSDKLIDDTPIGLWEACVNPQTAQPIGIDLGGSRGRGARIRNRASGDRGRKRERRSGLGWATKRAFGRMEQSAACDCQAGTSVQYLDPGSLTAAVAALRLLIGKASQAAQVTPIGTGPIAAIALGQLLADGSSDRRWQRCGADVHRDRLCAGQVVAEEGEPRKRGSRSGEAS